MQEQWKPAWTKHRHLVPPLRTRIAAQGPLPFRLHDGRDVDWSESPNGTDEGLLRFLQARNGDVQQAATMFLKQLEWRRRAFPIHREGRVAEILDEALPHKERRFAKMGTNSEGLPVIKQDLMWGCFVTERFSALDCVRAYILFLEENVVMAPTFLERQMVILSYGGFCPVDWGHALAAALQDNYPERLVRACVWPVPVFLCKTVRTFCVLFASKELNAKISIESEEAMMLQKTALQASQLPPYMQGGISAIIERDKPDPALIRKLVVDAFRNRGRRHELQDWPPPLDAAALASPQPLPRSKASTLPPKKQQPLGYVGRLANSLCICYSRGPDGGRVQENDPKEAVGLVPGPDLGQGNCRRGGGSALASTREQHGAGAALPLGTRHGGMLIALAALLVLVGWLLKQLSMWPSRDAVP